MFQMIAGHETLKNGLKDFPRSIHNLLNIGLVDSIQLHENSK